MVAERFVVDGGSDVGQQAAAAAAAPARLYRRRAALEAGPAPRVPPGAWTFGDHGVG